MIIRYGRRRSAGTSTVNGEPGPPVEVERLVEVPGVVLAVLAALLVLVMASITYCGRPTPVAPLAHARAVSAQVAPTVPPPAPSPTAPTPSPTITPTTPAPTATDEPPKPGLLRRVFGWLGGGLDWHAKILRGN